MWAWIAAALLSCLPAVSEQGRVGDPPLQDPAKPYLDFSKSGSGFYGSGRELPDPVNSPSVRIGVLAPEKDPEGLQMRHGVALAIEEANQKGGYCGTPFEAIFRPDDGPWGIVAKRVVELAYDDQVWTIIGGLDGARTHIAELVVAKAWVPVVSPTATDSTIDYANVPWVFRCAPADTRQAEALLDFVQQQGFQNVVVLSELQREAHTGYLRLQEEAARRHFSWAAHLQFAATDPAQVIPQVQGIRCDALIVWSSPGSVLPLIRGLRAAGITAPVLGPGILATPGLAAQAESLGRVIVAAPLDLSRVDEEFVDFVKRYTKLSGVGPSPTAFYAYDAARLVIRAIKNAGLNRARIRDQLAGGSLNGISGKIQFDSLRGNPAPPVLLTLKNGRWQRQP